jgi:hypothetical protein
MLGFEADKRIGFTKLEIERYHHDVDDWKPIHDEVAECWIWEDLIAKANFLFGRIMKLDLNIQKHLFKYHDADSALLDVVRDLATEWLEASVSMQDRAKQLLAEYGTVDGYDELKANIEAAQSFLTPDAEFFNSDELAEARDQAIESHRAGLAEPLLSNGYTAR